MPTVEVHGRRVATHHFPPAASGSADAAAGPRAPVLCLPSTGLSGLQWRRLAKLLSKAGHEVWALDFLGYGESEDWHGRAPDPERGPFETRYDVDAAAAVLDLCAGPVHLVGHSYGGRVGLRLGLRDPGRILSLALFEPTCFGVLRSTQDAEAQAELLDYDHDGRFLADDFGGSEAWVERFVDYWSGPGTFAELSPDERARWLRSSRKMFEEVRETALDDLPHTRYVDELGALPTLVMAGALSTKAGRSCAQTLAARMPRGTYLEFEDLGHMGPVLASREVAEPILAHIEAVEQDVAGR